MRDTKASRFVRVRGAREHNLKNVDVDIPRDALVTDLERAVGADEAARALRPAKERR